MPERISPRQLMALFVVSRISLTLIYHGADPVVKQDVWWEAMADTLLMMLVIWGLSFLWRRFPGQNLVQVMEILLGPILGKMLASLYVLFVLLMFSSSMRLAGDVFVITSLPRTPLVLVVGALAAMAARCVRAGVEVLARCAEVILPILAASLIVIFFVLLPYVRLEQLLPFEVLVVGPLPHLRAMTGTLARTLELISVGMLYSLCHPQAQVPRMLYRAEGLLAVGWGSMFIAIVGVLGGNFRPFPFPWLMTLRTVEAIRFIERIDALILAVWVLGIFIRVSLLLWTAAQGLSQILGLRQYQLLAFPLASIGTTYAITQAASLSHLLYQLREEVLTPFMLTFVVVIPLGLLLLAALRRIRGSVAKTDGA